MRSSAAVTLPKAVPPGLPLQPGDPAVVGPYRLVRRLGSGGMGTVFLASLEHGPLVALKTLRPELAQDEAFLTRFRYEVAAARRVAGWCTARVLAADLAATVPYFVTEYVDGPPLDRAVAASGPLPQRALEGFAAGVAAALSAIHGAGLVHRDLKPANVLLAPSGPRVIDFGIARALDHAVRLTETGMLLGTPGWMGPEQLTGQPCGTPLDIFGWGGLVVYAGTGRKPFGDGPLIVVSARIVHAEPDLAHLPPALAGLVGAALAKDPDARPTAEELLQELLGHPADAGQALTRRLERTWVLPDQGPDHRDWATAAPVTARGAATATRLRATALLVTVVVMALGAWLLPSIAGGDSSAPAVDTPSAPVPTTPDAAAPDADPPVSADPGPPTPDEGRDAGPVEQPLGSPVVDGGVEFTVVRTRCGFDQFDVFSLTRRPTRGAYCLIDVEVANVGDEAHDLSGFPQVVIDQYGGRYAMDGGSHPISLEGGLFGELVPGADATGTLAFDLPENRHPVTLELHGSPDGDGVSVRVEDERVSASQGPIESPP